MGAVAEVGVGAVQDMEELLDDALVAPGRRCGEAATPVGAAVVAASLAGRGGVATVAGAGRPGGAIPVVAPPAAAPGRARAAGVAAREPDGRSVR